MPTIAAVMQGFIAAGLLSRLRWDFAKGRLLIIRRLSILITRLALSLFLVIRLVICLLII